MSNTSNKIVPTPKIQQMLDIAKAKLVMKQPFFASLLLQRPIQWSKQFKTMGVDKRAQIHVNPDGIANMSQDEITYNLCHDVLHIAGQHFIRTGGRDKDTWNMAGDAWVNDTLNHCDGFSGKMPPGWFTLPDARNKTIDELYNLLQQQQQPQPQNGKGKPQKGQGQSQPSSGKGQKDKEEWQQSGQPDLPGQGDPQEGDGDGDGESDPSDSEVQEIQAQVKLAVAQAANAARAAGKLPQQLQDFADKVLAPKVKWYEVLERFVLALAKSEDYSWQKRNKRMPREVFLPSIPNVPMIGEIAIQFDLSGSITPDMIKGYLSHLENIFMQVKPQKIHILWTDTQVQKHEIIENISDIPVNGQFSGGGTDMEEGFRFLDAEGITPDVFLCFTDGYTPFTNISVEYPIVWIIQQSNVVPPYGETIKIED